MPRPQKTMERLLALLTIAGAVLLGGCPQDQTEQATVADVNNEAFTFPVAPSFIPAWRRMPRR
jgi:hypothetical protein